MFLLLLPSVLCAGFTRLRYTNVQVCSVYVLQRCVKWEWFLIKIHYAEFEKALNPRVRFKKSSQRTHTGYLCLLQYFQLYCSTCSIQGRFFLFLFSWDRSIEPFVKTKFIRGTSVIFSTVIWSYVTPFLNWRQNDEWNSLEDSRLPCALGKAITIRHNGQKDNNAFNKTLICN